MALSFYEKNNYLENIVLKNFCQWQSINAGSMLVGTDYRILAANELCKQYFNITDISGLTSISIFKIVDPVILERTSIQGLTNPKNIELQGRILLKLHKIVIEDKIPLQFVCFWPFNKSFRSLLLHYLPILHESGEVVAIQQIVSEFSFWGIQEYFNFTEKIPSNYLTILLDNHNLPIKLSTRQHEVLFLLVSKIGQRQAAHILNISYGSISKMIRDSICPKFNIHDANYSLLIERAMKMGYQKYIPQSLCRPCIIVLDYKILIKYFSDAV